MNECKESFTENELRRQHRFNKVVTFNWDILYIYYGKSETLEKAVVQFHSSLFGDEFTFRKTHKKVGHGAGRPLEARGNLIKTPGCPVDHPKEK